MGKQHIEEESVNDDALVASLDMLLKAADAENVVDKLRKGGQVFSGFNDEDGKKGGGASPPTGGLDDMMIGKFVKQGFSAEQATAMAGAMAGKKTQAEKDQERAEGDDDEDEEEDGEMSGYMRGYMAAMKKMGKSEDSEEDADALQKSHYDAFTEDKDIAEGVNVAPFMEQLTVRTTGALDGLRKSVHASQVKQTGVNQAMAGALYQLGTLVKSQSEIINELGNRLGMVERAPVSRPKGARTQAQAMEKSLDGGGERGERLNKSEFASAISYLRFEKGVQAIEGTPMAQLAVFAESGGDISPGVVEYVDKFLATHPNERKEALQYH